MKTAKERVIFNNYFSSERFESTRRSLWESYKIGDFLHEFDLRSEKDIPDQEVFEEMNFEEQIEWIYFLLDFKKFVESQPVIVTGFVGRWNGKSDGGTRINTFSDVEKLWQNCDSISVYHVNGHLYIKCSHHDGTNFIELKKLTQRGVDLYERHNRYDDAWSDRKLYETLFKNPYSVLPNYGHQVYGWKKIEYQETA